LLDRAFVSAMRFRWRYRGHESKDKAIASLRRPCPGFTTIQYTNAFQKGTDLYNRALDALRANEEMLAKVRPDTGGDIPRKIIDQLRRRMPGFKLATYKQAIMWIMFWHYLR
jgi:hypothetical protein